MEWTMECFFLNNFAFARMTAFVLGPSLVTRKPSEAEFRGGICVCHFDN